jgi:hypothetical protein
MNKFGIAALLAFSLSACMMEVGPGTGSDGMMTYTQDCGKEIMACGCGTMPYTDTVYLTTSCESGQAFNDPCAGSCPDGTRAYRRVCSCD